MYYIKYALIIRFYIGYPRKKMLIIKTDENKEYLLNDSNKNSI